ncbi:MAG TPA: hypothetical protein VFC54_09910 [Pseudolabrys sp.]|nr:hypothetical protein [Pseudolabrys sp.]
MLIDSADSKASPQSAVPYLFRAFGFDANGEERVATVVAITLAVTVVAAVAILMGMV